MSSQTSTIEPHDDPGNDGAVRLRQQALVADFGLYALREDALDTCLTQACVVASQALQTRFAKVLRYRPETQDLLLLHGVGWRDGVVGHTVLGADLASPAGFALRTKLPVISNHLGEETRFRSPAILVEHGIHRAINVIIEGDGKPYGVLEVDSTNRLVFTSQDSHCLQALANVISAAIDRDARQARQRALLVEKDLLMQEVHHRVKNSLQLVQTMLNLQARAITPGEERDRLTDAAARIMTIAAVHRRLHLEGSVQETDAEGYFEGLLADIRESIIPEAIARPLTLAVEPMILRPDQITPLGLVTTELVTNAVKYGAGAIAVAIVRREQSVVITVEDEGPGFPPGFTPGTGRSLGMRLIAAMARAAGSITIDGTVAFGRISVQVPLAPA